MSSQKLMLEKDEEIGRLNSKIETLVSQIPNMQLDSEQATIRHLQTVRVSFFIPQVGAKNHPATEFFY